MSRYRTLKSRLQNTFEYAFEKVKISIIVSIVKIARALDMEFLPELKEQDNVVELDDYSPGLINDYDGGDVDRWQDYIRCEIKRANDHWRAQIEQKYQD